MKKLSKETVGLKNRKMDQSVIRKVTQINDQSFDRSITSQRLILESYRSKMEHLPTAIASIHCSHSIYRTD